MNRPRRQNVPSPAPAPRGAWVCALLALVGSGGALLAGCASNNAAAKNGNQQPDSIFSLMAPPTPAEAVAWSIDPYDADKRYRGILLLVNAPFGGEPIYVEMYQQALRDSDSSVRAAAVRGLAMHGSPEDVPLILPMLNDPDHLLRWEVARALQRLHNPEAIKPLLEHLFERNEPEAQVRASVASALGQYADTRVLEALFAALGDRDLNVNLAALDSLRTLTGQDFGLNIRSWIAWRKNSEDPFFGRTAYIFPVFYRDKTFLEMIVPFWAPPNEIAASPVGLDDPVLPPDRTTSVTAGNAGDGSVRKN